MTRKGEFSSAEEVLRHFLVSSAYQTRVAQDKLRLALISTFSNLTLSSFSNFTLCTACALHAHKYSIILEQCRKLMFAHQFNNEPLRILLASLSCGVSQTDQFVSSTLQKYLLRELRMCMDSAKGKSLVWNTSLRRYGPAPSDKSADGDGDDDVADEDRAVTSSAVGYGEKKEELNDRFAAVSKPTKDNPVIVTIYAQACNTVRSYQSALCEFASIFPAHQPVINPIHTPSLPAGRF